MASSPPRHFGLRILDKLDSGTLSRSESMTFTTVRRTPQKRYEARFVEQQSFMDKRSPECIEFFQLRGEQAHLLPLIQDETA